MIVCILTSARTDPSACICVSRVLSRVFTAVLIFNWNPVDMSHVTVLLAHPVRPSTVNFDILLHL